MPARRAGSPSAANMPRLCSAPSMPGLDVVQTQAPSATPDRATKANAGPVPIAAARLPRTGPRRAPATAAESVTPISSPRRSRGAPAVSQLTAAVQEQALPMPPANRVRTRTQKLSASPNTRLVTDMSPSPRRTVALTPSRLVTGPLGKALRRAPTAKAPVRTPASDFERPRVAA